MKMLNILLPMFAEKNFVLIGDNTQYDLSIYLTAAKNYPDNVKAIYIRQVVPLPERQRRWPKSKRHSRSATLNSTTEMISRL